MSPALSPKCLPSAAKIRLCSCRNTRKDVRAPDKRGQTGRRTRKTVVFSVPRLPQSALRWAVFQRPLRENGQP